MEQRNILRDLVAPPRVRAGDTVAIISPSAPAVGWWPHRVERGRAYLESLGLKVRVMPNAGGKAGWVSASPEARAADIHEASWTIASVSSSRRSVETTPTRSCRISTST